MDLVRNCELLGTGRTSFNTPSQPERWAVRLSQAVERPGALVDLSFGPGDVASIVDDAVTDNGLPLLAYLLQELYFASGRGETVTEEPYRNLGGVTSAIARQADHTVEQISAEAGVGAEDGESTSYSASCSGSSRFRGRK
ncbi:hypothetical protein [Streptomyces sp. NBC_00055]|uniref:nSTAND1 domain-containing NTPase n=1 Tax=Streptomyces sp. NBC_00055 TaxID=2975632 RepID=UPI0032493CDC